MPDRHHALIFGASHAACLRRAMQRFESSHTGFSASVAAAGVRHLPGGLFVRAADGSETLNPVIQTSIDAIAERDPTPNVWLVAALRCNEASRLTLYEHATPFAIAGRNCDEECLYGRGQIFSEELFKEILRNRLARLTQELSRLGNLPVAGVIQLAPPPPLRDNDEIEDLLPETLIERARAAGLFKGDYSISPVTLRKRAWELECQVSKEITESAGAFFLQHDNDFIGPDGLRGRDSAQDGIHGNVNWGLAVLAQIESTVMAYAKRNNHERA